MPSPSPTRSAKATSISSSSSSSSSSSHHDSPSPADVLDLDGPASDFLCSIEANTFGIEFQAFSISDASSPPLINSSSSSNPHLIFSVSKDAPPQGARAVYDTHSTRLITYHFPAVFLRLSAVQTTLRFAVGDEEVRNLRMIERHFVRTQLPASSSSSSRGRRAEEDEEDESAIRYSYRPLKSYDFTFPFCMPNSVNEWEATYDMPELSSREQRDILRDGTVSDSFYFVDGVMVMHNRAIYKYE